MEIQLPHNFTPRSYQLPFLQAFDSGLYDRFLLVWHRRAGKDLTCFNLVPRFALQRPRIITYVFPTLKMGREILWEGMDNEGNKFIDHYVPPQIIASKPNDTRMTIDFVNGSIFRVGGSDNPDSLRGGNSSLFIFSEWAEQDPYAWTVARPILKANNGLAVFEYTPKGDNHAKQLYDNAQKWPRWYVQRLVATDTGVFTQASLDEELRELIAEYGETEGRARFEQEYMCSFESPVIGSYFGEQMRKAENEQRITNVPVEMSLPVNTVWDLGVGDATAIWFYQVVGKEIRIIDYLEASGEGLEYYARELKEKKYVYGEHYAPHDIEVRELGTGKSRLETAASLGITFRVVPNLSIDDGINAARQIINQCWFDMTRCERGIMALRNYKKEWDDKRKIYKNHPLHDWSSHGADSFRYLAVSYKNQVASVPQYNASKWRI